MSNSYLIKLVDSLPMYKGNSIEGKMKCDLHLLKTMLPENFFDIPELSTDKYSTDGLFFQIPLKSESTLYEQDNQVFEVVVYKIENHSSFCPMRIDFKIINDKEWNFILYDQSKNITEKHCFLSYVDDKMATEQIDKDRGLVQMSLSEILEYFKIR